MTGVSYHINVCHPFKVVFTVNVFLGGGKEDECVSKQINDCLLCEQ